MWRRNGQEDSMLRPETEDRSEKRQKGTADRRATIDRRECIRETDRQRHDTIKLETKIEKGREKGQE